MANMQGAGARRWKGPDWCIVCLYCAAAICTMQEPASTPNVMQRSTPKLRTYAAGCRLFRSTSPLLMLWQAQKPHLAKAHDSQGFADDGDAHVLGPLPLAGLHRGVRLRDVAAERADQRDAVLCSRHCVGGGGVHHQAAMLCSREHRCQAGASGTGRCASVCTHAEAPWHRCSYRERPYSRSGSVFMQGPSQQGLLYP